MLWGAAKSLTSGKSRFCRCLHPISEAEWTSRKKSATLNPAQVNETEPRPVLSGLDPTGSQAKFSTGGAFPRPPAVGPCFRRNLVSCGYGRGQNQTGLPNRNSKPTPAWLSGAMRRSRAITKTKKRTIGEFLLCLFFCWFLSCCILPTFFVVPFTGLTTKSNKKIC